MSLKIERCRETGICTLLKDDGTQVDLMPNEVDALRQAGKDKDAILAIVVGADPTFAATLEQDELRQVAVVFSGEE